MKKILVALFCSLFSLAIAAQDAISPKYGLGTVPLDNNGTVTFSETFAIPEGMTQDDCYNLLLNWAKGRFAKPYSYSGRILNEDNQTHRFIFHVEELIVFKRNAVVADESRITYNFSAVVNKDDFTVKMTDIKYRYEEGREGSKTFPAEDWITDKEAYNKKGSKFLKSTGKFRVKTIDLKDILFMTAADAVSANN
jgi:colicin import membrane protein